MLRWLTLDVHKKQQFSWTNHHHHHNYDAEITIMQTQTPHHISIASSIDKRNIVQEKIITNTQKLNYVKDMIQTKPIKHAHPIPEGRNV